MDHPKDHSLFGLGLPGYPENLKYIEFSHFLSTDDRLSLILGDLGAYSSNFFPPMLSSKPSRIYTFYNDDVLFCLMIMFFSLQVWTLSS